MEGVSSRLGSEVLTLGYLYPFLLLGRGSSDLINSQQLGMIGLVARELVVVLDLGTDRSPAA